MFCQFPLDAAGKYHAAGLARGEDLLNAKDLADFQAWKLQVLGGKCGWARQA